MSITETLPTNVEDDVDVEDEDFVNISVHEEEKEEDERLDISANIGGAVDGNNLDVTLPSMRTQSRDGGSSGDNNLSASAGTASADGNLAPSPARSQSKDSRFMCAICIDEVSDEPVVTKCGHLFCWPCLYQWLAPGMLVNEYYAAFGGGGGIGIGRAANNHGGLNNFISEMATNSSNSHDRPYDPARFNSARRVCPVCKAFCSVDSVIPIYIHVHAKTTGSRADRQGGDVTTTQSLSQEQSQHDEEHFNERGGYDDDIHSNESPLSPHAFEPSTANIGLRQRRPLTASTSNEVSNNDAPLSPQTTQHMYENIPSNATTTPVIRNGGEGNIEVPNRPLRSPTPSFANTNIESAASGHHTQYNNPNMATAPILSTSTITSSSSFRLAYRPRHVDYSRSLQFQNRQMGGLMGIVSGLVNSIDNIGAANQQQSTTRDQPEVPQIHRSDNGLGGIGRASEQNNVEQHFDGRGAAAGGMGGEDSSLAMAREFLSRLLFMLACFVILCLLLF